MWNLLVESLLVSPTLEVILTGLTLQECWFFADALEALEPTQFWVCVEDTDHKP